MAITVTPRWSGKGIGDSTPDGKTFSTDGTRVFDATTDSPGSDDDVDVLISGAIPQRSQIAQDSLVKYPILFNLFRKDDDLTSGLPGTPTGRYLGLIGGTFASASPSLQTEDLKAAGATNKYARWLFELPAEYDPGNTVQVQFHAGMLTTIADTAATIVVAVYKCDKAAGISSNLVVTSAQSINSLTLQDFSSTLTPTGLLPGDILDCRAQVVVNDAASGTAVKAILGAAYFLLNIKG